MARRAFFLLIPLAVLLGGCRHDIEVGPGQQAEQHGAIIFQQRCGGCHTMKAAATHGSATRVRTKERNDGPNFNARCETQERVLYAIRNGGFSGAIMPQNIVIGQDADDVAKFVSRYSGRDVGVPLQPQPPTPRRGQNEPVGNSGSQYQACKIQSGGK